MHIDVSMTDAAHARAAAVCRPPGCAKGVRPARPSASRRPAGAYPPGLRTFVSLLLLVLLPIGVLHRSSTGSCRLAHRATVAAGASVVHDAVHDAAHEAAVAAPAEHDRRALAEPHEHDRSIEQDGAAPGSCGPAVLAERSASGGAGPSRTVPSGWRALSPLALASPPPAPPPRLS